MHHFLATIHPMGGAGMYMITPLSGVDPGFGQGGGVDPGYGHPGGGWNPTDPGFGQGRPPTDPGFGIGSGLYPSHGLPGSGNYPSHGLPGGGQVTPPIVVPPPPGVAVNPPINIPRPQLPAGSLVAVPLPEGATPKQTPPPGSPPGAKPYVVWGGPGTDSVVAWLAPPAPGQPK
jgi:hypothetical protein